MEALWRPLTRKRYAGHVQRFTQYYHQRNVDPFQATHKIGIEYLTEYFHTGLGYLSVNTTRSVLPIIIKTENEIPFGKLPLACKFLKVFYLKQALPRYSTTWDVLIVLKYVKSLQGLKQCDLKSLLHRLVILLCITTGQRDQILFNMNIDFMIFEANKITIFLSHLEQYIDKN